LTSHDARERRRGESSPAEGIGLLQSGMGSQKRVAAGWPGETSRSFCEPTDVSG
jgi:hypothetical protein